MLDQLLEDSPRVAKVTIDRIGRLIRDLELRKHPEGGLVHISAALLPILRTIHSTQKEQLMNVPAKLSNEYRNRYLDEIAPATNAGRIIKFTKDGSFVAADDGTPISDEDTYLALCDETQISWIKFKGIGEAPDRVSGLLYDGFVLPSRESLGDLDHAQWEQGLDGKPADPWQHQIAIVLQNCESGELFTFTTTSNTGRRAVGNLLRTYDRLRGKDELPLVKLKVSGFEHRDKRVGWVKVPAFMVVGRAPRDTAPKSTSPADLLDDSIPF
jgi:hypothetical protein